MSNPFEDTTQTATPVADASTTTDPVATDAAPADQTSAEELPEVETPEALDDEVDIPAGGTTEAAAGESKPAAKEKKEPARPPVPEGYVSPVAFAKILSEHLTKKAKEKDPNADAVEIAPQMVYSYMKNADPTKAGVKNPWPRYSEGGRNNLLKVEESLQWWDDKDARVAASKENQATKAAKKAAKAEAAPAAEEAPSGPVQEAE